MLVLLFHSVEHRGGGFAGLHKTYITLLTSDVERKGQRQ